MICRTCLRRAAGLSQRPQALRTFTTSIAFRNAAPAAAPPGASQQIPDLSTPLTKPGGGDDASSSSATATESKAALSSCPAGTILTGLNYLKGKADPVAAADEEYPDWLWRCLEVQTKTEEADETAGDEFSKSRKQRRLAAKRQRILEAKILASGDLEALAPKIPLQQQTINLPAAEDGSVDGAILALTKREELRKAMRKERRAKIKETNYLKSM